MRIGAAGSLMAVLAVVAVSPLAGQSGTVDVDTRSSVYLAGGNVYSSPPAGGQPGIAPPEIPLSAGTDRILLVAATGSAAFCGPGVCIAPTPDGPAIAGTDISASGGISGIAAPTSGFLAGVFLGPTLPAVAPSSLNFVALTTAFPALAPALGQVFFIGDGFAPGGVQQQFLVPDDATRLYFGIADAGGFVGNPGFYDDNVGTYVATFSVSSTSVVPEPSTVVLFGTGAILVGLATRRRRRGAADA